MKCKFEGKSHCETKWDACRLALLNYGFSLVVVENRIADTTYHIMDGWAFMGALRGWDDTNGWHIWLGTDNKIVLDIFNGCGE